MSILERIGDGVKYAVSQTTSVTKELVEITKLNSAKRTREHEIELAYTALGKLLLERELANPDSPAAPLCKKISDNKKAVVELAAKIKALKNEGKETRKNNSEEFRKAESTVVEEDVAVEEAAAPTQSAEASEPVEEASESEKVSGVADCNEN